MATMTLAIPDEIKKEMDLHDEVNWSAIARKAIIKRLADQKLFEKLVENSTITEENSIKLGRTINRELAKHYK